MIDLIQYSFPVERSIIFAGAAYLCLEATANIGLGGWAMYSILKSADKYLEKNPQEIIKFERRGVIELSLHLGGNNTFRRVLPIYRCITREMDRIIEKNDRLLYNGRPLRENKDIYSDFYAVK
jgi:hypothetical protein